MDGQGFLRISLDRCTHNTKYCGARRPISAPDTVCHYSINSLPLIMRDDGGQNNKYKRNNSDQSQRNGCNNRDTQTTLQNHSIQAKSIQCALADTAVGGFPLFFVFFIRSYLSLLGRRETRRNKCTTEPCKFEFPFLSFLIFFYLFFGFFLSLRSPSSFNLPSRTVTIRNVCLDIVELPALLSSSAVVHN